MRTITRSRLFAKDRERMIKRGFRQNPLILAVTALTKDGRLGMEYRPHKLRGEYEGYWECHLAPDWLLIYSLSAGSVYLYRTGSHSDLFE